jgi:dihydroorotate dehydrogenase (NAD+) catalytic subunit
MGGIVDAGDALEFIMAGATAVQVGTANFIHPGAAVTVLEELEEWLVQHDVATVRELIGSLNTAMEL